MKPILSTTVSVKSLFLSQYHYSLPHPRRGRLPNHTVLLLRRRRARRRLVHVLDSTAVVVRVGRLRLLGSARRAHLVAAVGLVGVVAAGGWRVRRRGLRVVIGLGVVVGRLLAVARRRRAVVRGLAVAVAVCPAGAPVGLAAGATAATGGDAGAEDKEEEGSNDDDHEDKPTDPVIPGR